MKKYSIILFLFVAACTTHKKAQKYFDKHQDKAAQYCDSRFPNVILNDPEVKKGESIIDTVYVPEVISGEVDCPPEKVNTKIKYQVQTQIKEIRIHQVDTLIKQVENTKRVKALEVDKSNLQCKLDDLSKSMVKARKLIYWLIGALAVAVAWIFRKPLKKAIVPST